MRESCVRPYCVRIVGIGSLALGFRHAMGEPQVHPLAIAFAWVGRIFGVVAIMVLPGVGGAWLDRRLGVGWISLVGMVTGLVVGVGYLITMTRNEFVVKKRGEAVDHETDADK